MSQSTLWEKLQQGRAAMHLQDLTSVLKTDRAVVKQHHANTLDGFQPPEDEMIQLGDNNVENHYHVPPDQPTAKPSTLGTLAKLAIGAGLIATGAGAGVGGLMIANALTSKPAAVAPVTPALPAKPSDAYGFDLEFVK